MVVLFACVLLSSLRPANFVAEEFVFVVTDASGAKAYGFCRRVLPCGNGGR